ncbi:DUF3105 domain-containing protein [Actinomadura sp. LOL_016]|uniref:DUF3105 domain-containing protein n=1 Tax=unclassified Actinomadura TaxID=2626254 RepID=UPI003A7FFDB7
MSKGARNKNARNSNPKSRSSSARKNALTQREVPWGGIAFFTVIGVVAVVAISYAFLQTRSSAADGGSSIAGVVSKDGLSRDHTQDGVDYEDAPPMGGAHDPMWQNCDGIVYGDALRDENAVHSLEHGAVWITYRPGLAAGQVESLREKVESTSYTFMSPYPSQDSPITLTAWGSQLDLQDAGDARLDEFLRAFVKGPQTPEPGAACTGAKATA